MYAHRFTHFNACTTHRHSEKEGCLHTAPLILMPALHTGVQKKKAVCTQLHSFSCLHYTQAFRKRRLSAHRFTHFNVCTTHRRSEKEGCLHTASLILMSALHTGEWSHSQANHSALGRAPGTPKLGGNVGTRAGLDALGKRKISHT
jgi:hypothetical protein